MKTAYIFNKFVIKGYFNDNEDYMPLIEEIKDCHI